MRRISEILEVDVSDIIYGNGEILTSVISKKKMTMSAVIFCAYVILTLTLFLLTNDLKNRGGPFAPYILVRVFLIPIGMAGFGWLSIKTAGQNGVLRSGVWLFSAPRGGYRERL